MTGFDRLATTTYPLGTTEVLTYDADSNVSTRKTRANQTIGFTYDTLNRLKTKTPPAPAAHARNDGTGNTSSRNRLRRIHLVAQHELLNFACRCLRNRPEHHCLWRLEP